MNPLFFILVLAAIFLFLLWKFISEYSSSLSAPFVGTESKIVKRILSIADLKKDDILYDLGSGDGRIVISAALMGSKAVGIEIDPVKAIYSRIFIKLLKLDKQIKIKRGNFFETDLSQASVVTMFLLHETNQKLKSKLQNELKKGTRIISYSFIIEGWKPQKTYINNDSVWGPIYLYKV